ncbi:delta-60 repeat domain-containing protein [Wenzhouxiangella limi]|uniref:Delta-60 repeat domain-containing protein n=1 Tax=Wenzhouxiangella limi TaxID=2707351 RepID=A0A845UYE5_9GAMM|nr:delta-60 repeat domain-containing protein [Wenzhouxiangella limi]NDY96437.1 delta-60 repeat domain-containing protein [Wenzhouxiangella limi]
MKKAQPTRVMMISNRSTDFRAEALRCACFVGAPVQAMALHLGCSGGCLDDMLLKEGKAMIAVMFRRLVSVILLFGILAPASSEAQLPLDQPDLDLRAATSGKVLLALPDGGAIVSHNGRFVGGEPGHAFLYRLRPDGTIDPDWNVSAIGVSDMALVDDDLYLAGSFSTVNGVSRQGLASVSLATGALSNWDPNSGNSSRDFRVLEVVGDSVYVAGGFTQVGTTPSDGFAKIDRITGVVDEAFSPVVPGSFSPIRTMGSDGVALFIGGSFTEVNGDPRSFAAKLSLDDGSVDPTWNPDFSSSISELHIDGGWLYAVGCFTQVNGTNRRFVARVATAGAGDLDATWDPSPNRGCLQTVYVDDTHAYISGFFEQLGGVDAFRFGRVAKTGAGAIDATWGVSVDDRVASIITLPGGAVLIAGSFHDVNDTYHPGLARLDRNSGTLLGPEIYVESSGIVQALAAAPDGGVYVGGNFHRLVGTGLLRRGLLRLTPSGELDATWASPLAGGARVETLVADVDHLYVGGRFRTYDSTGLNNLVRLSHSGLVDSSWTPEPNGTVHTLAIDETSNSLFLGGWFDFLGGESRRRLAEVDLVTGQPTAFNPDANSAVYAIALDGNDIYVGGRFTEIGGEPRQRLAKLSRTGIVDPSFVADADDSVRALLPGPGGTLYVGGWFSNISGLGRRGLVRLLRDSGAPDPAWDTFPNSRVYSLNPSTEGFYVGGDFFEIGGVARSRVARVSHQGEVAPLFAPGGFSGRIEAALEQGSEVTLGGWINWSETAAGIRRGLAAFPVDATPVASTLTITSALPGNTQPHQFYRVEVNGVGGEAPLANQRVTVVCDSGASCAMTLDSQGNGACEIASRTPGTRTLTASYAGSPFFSSATATRPHNVATIVATPPANPAFDLRSPGFVSGMVRTSDDKLVVAGGFNRIGDQARRGLARLLPDGTADPAFRADALGGSVRAVARDASDHVFAVGFFDLINGVFRPRLAKLDTEGNVVPDWIPARTDVNRDVAYVDPDGDLIVRGFTFFSGGVGVTRLLKLSGADGEERAGFDVTVTSSGSLNVQVAGDDTHLYVYGVFEEVNGVPRRNLARLSLSGEVDLDWNPSPDSFVGDVVPDAAGGIYVAGQFDEIAGQTTLSRLVRLSSSGTLVTAFNPAPDGTVDNLFLEGSSLYVGGFFDQIGGLTRDNAAKINATTGIADPAFQNPSLAFGLFERLGDALWSSNFGFEMGASDVLWMGAVRRDPGTGELLPTAPITRPAQIYALARQPDGATLIGGSFARFGSSQRNLVRVSAEGQYDTAFSPALDEDNSVRALAVRGNGDIYAGGLGGLSKVGVDGSIDSAFISPNDWVLALADAGDGLIAGGWFTEVGPSATPRNRIAKLDYDTGAAIAGWDPDSNGTVEAIAIGPDDAVYLGGSFTEIGGESRQRLAKLSVDGSLNGNWQPQASSTVRALLVDGPDVYVGGFFFRIDGIIRRGIARLAAADGALADWAPGDPNSFASVYALTRAQDGDILVGGSFRRMGGAFRSNAAKIDPVSGIADPLWNPSLDGPVFAILAGYGNTPASFRQEQIEQNIAIGGSFEFQGAAPMPGFVAVPREGRPTTDGIFCDRFEATACVPVP